eukprot:CAMPEP_0170609950 /NCGR_PEP_ID=MMETSP0224-20130122/22393_1 /TAXON_ID=285029 /ORGANISM="Togula jolla, Strain CCCM 725" /LENGTH=273 /DNA_ID=CAMNT_0010935281 /DNA_START=79 /DNA_END=900 /DNA_ORIENTATION=-
MGLCQCCEKYDSSSLNVPPAKRNSSRVISDMETLRSQAPTTTSAASTSNVSENVIVIKGVEDSPIEPQVERADSEVMSDDEDGSPKSINTREEVRAYMSMEGTVATKGRSHSRGRLSSNVSHLGTGPLVPALPDFRGTWKMTRCLGNFDAFMKEMGISWALRKAAATVGYGVNTTFHTIEQNGDVFSCTTKNPKGVFVRTLVINGAEQDDVDPVDKKALTVIPSWDGQAIHIECRVKDGADMPLTRRYLEGDVMVMEQTSPKGVAVRRFFERT